MSLQKILNFCLANFCQRVTTLRVLIPGVCLYLCTGAVNKDDSHCGGVVPLGCQSACCYREDNTTPQPPFQTRQCSLLVTTSNHLFNQSILMCSGYYRGTTPKASSQRHMTTTPPPARMDAKRDLLCIVSACPQGMQT